MKIAVGKLKTLETNCPKLLKIEKLIRMEMKQSPSKIIMDFGSFKDPLRSVKH